LLVAVAVVSGLLGLSTQGPPPTFEACLKNLRPGPESFLEYLCLGTPGLPDRPGEVRRTLEELLRKKPGEPHARLYLAMMRLYNREPVDPADFSEPLQAFDQQQKWVDGFFARLASLERICLLGQEECTILHPRNAFLEGAERIAEQIGHPDLKRLAAIARLKFSMQLETFGMAREAEKRLDTIPGKPPPWLLVLETTSRARLARSLGNDSRVRDLYAALLSSVPEGSITHAAALAGLAEATAQLAWQGLGDRKEAERLLREAIEEQRHVELRQYNSTGIGSVRTAVLLSLLVGPNEQTPRNFEQADLVPFGIEMLLQGDAEGRAGALDLARRELSEEKAKYINQHVARAHAEFFVGSQEVALEYVEAILEGLRTIRRREPDEQTRMSGDFEFATDYQTVISDLLETSEGTAARLEYALKATEELRTRVLLERLARREGKPPEDLATTIPTVAELRSALRSEEALVSFMVWAPRPTFRLPYTRGHSWALVLTKADLRAVEIARGETLEPAVRAWTRLVDQDAARPGAKRLFEEVMKPVLDVLPPGIRTLSIVPDGPLYRLPFDALSETGGPPYLAERFSIATVPSASVWLHLRSRPPVRPGVAIAFANTPEGPAVRTAEQRGEVEAGQLAALLHAREEAQAAVDSFPSGSILLTGAAATPDRLSPSDLARASLVHFAAHGIVNDQEPDDSFLLLSPSAGGSGKLRVADVERFDWTGKTVILSACQSTVGAFRMGEGVLSLARAFFAGGASAVVGTLAAVRDQDQQQLFEGFYAALRQGASVGDALTAAKRQAIRSGAPVSAWANVILVGDSTVHPRAPESPARRWAVLAIVAVIALVAIAMGVRARRRGSETGTPA
jgi:CHAT domain-containing protein